MELACKAGSSNRFVDPASLARTLQNLLGTNDLQEIPNELTSWWITFDML